MTEPVVNKDTLFANIWDMANDLRGNMDASEYKNYILGFLFYAYLSKRLDEDTIKYLERRNDELLNGPRTNIYKTWFLREVANAVKAGKTEKEAIEQQVRQVISTFNFIIRPEYLWSNIIDKINDETANSQLLSNALKCFKDDLTTYANNYLDSSNTGLDKQVYIDFANIFDDVNLEANRLGEDSDSRSKFLFTICIKVNDMSAVVKDESGRDILGAIYENLIGKFAANAGKTGGEFYTPHEVSVMISKIVASRTVDHLKTLSDAEAQRFSLNVLDPTCGSGSLLLTLSNAYRKEIENTNISKKVKAERNITFYGQELNFTTYNLARMNLLMHGVDLRDMNLKNADTLDGDWPLVKGADEASPLKVDVIVSNPPYSTHWETEGKLEDERFKRYGALAPKTKADFSFLLHGLHHLNDHGTMGIVLPRGVLFRGGSEEIIRRTLVDENYIDAVIRLPEGLFYGTGIETVVMILRKDRELQDSKDRNNVIFIDASVGVEKDKKQNYLTMAQVERVVESYVERKDVPQFSRVVSIDEIKSKINDYSLYVPRYVDAFSSEDYVSLDDVLDDLQANREDIFHLENSINSQLKELGIDIDGLIAKHKRDSL